MPSNLSRVRGTELLAADTREQYRDKIARITLDSMVQFVGLLDAEGTVLEINPVTLDAVGIKLSDVEGKPFWTTFWWQVSEEIKTTLRDSLRRASQGEFVRWDTEIYGLAGGKETMTIDASLSPVKDERGKVVFIAFDGRDIKRQITSERESARHYEEHVRHSQAAASAERFHLAELLEQAPAGIGLMSGPEHRWTYVNERYIRMTGRSSASDFVGKTLRESLPEVQGIFVDLLNDAFRTGKPYIGREMMAMLDRAGTGEPEEAYFDFVYQPVRTVGDKVDGILVHAVEVTDRVAARRAAEETATRLRLAQTAGQIGTWEWDPVKNTNSLSEELHRMFGTRASDPDRVEQWRSRVHPADLDRVQHLMQEGHTTGSMEFEYRYLHPQLGQRWFYCKGSRLTDKTSMLGIVQDVTERKLAEKGRKDSDDRFRAIVETTPECVKLVARDGTLLHMNAAGLGMIGAQQLDSVAGKNVYNLIAPEHREQFKQFNERVCSGTKGILEFDIIGLQGVRRHMETHAVPLRNDDGSIVQLGVTRDISERKTAREASERLSAIISSSDDAIVSKDLNGIVMSWNAAAERIFGYTSAEMVGQPITKIIPEEMHADEIRILQTISRGERIEHFETERLTKSGKRIEISLTVSPVKNASGRIVGAAKIARDITQRKKAERSLHTAERLASVGRLAATVAHEINNPLEALTNLIYLARHSATMDDVRKYLTGAEEELDRVSHLTKQTLGFYRETKGASKVKVGPLVTSLLAVFASRTRNKGIEISPEIKDAPEISAVPGEIRQLIANLVGNSIDAVEGNGKIRVRVSAGTDWNHTHRKGVRLTVADNGPGIAAEYRAHLFEPFFTTKKEVGTGLGLWVCKSIVEKHRGSIRVKSCHTSHKGWTAFSVFLPLDAQHAGADEAYQRAV